MSLLMLIIGMVLGFILGCIVGKEYFLYKLRRGEV